MIVVGFSRFCYRLGIVLCCDAGHGAGFGGESPLWAELKRSTSLSKGKSVKICHEGS